MWRFLKITEKKEGYVAKTPSVVDVLCLPKQKDSSSGPEEHCFISQGLRALVENITSNGQRFQVCIIDHLVTQYGKGCKG